MADTVTSQTLQDGPAHLVMRFTNTSDGTGESAVDKITPSALTKQADGGTGRACSDIVIEKIIYFTDGMGVNLLWDATTDVVAVSLPTTMSDTICFDPPLWNNAGAGKTGKLQFTTVAHSAADRYVITIYARKVYA